MSKLLQWKWHIVTTFGCFVLFWIGDALIDALSFGGESFLHELLSVEPRELYMRTLTSLLLALFFLFLEVFSERRRNTESLLRHSDQLASTFFETTGDAVCIIDTATLTIASANAIFCQRYAISEKEMVGQSLADLVAARRLPREMQSQVEETVAGGSPLTREISHEVEGGNRQYEEMLTHPIGGGQSVLQVTRDITMRRNAEALLRESEARYRAIFDNTGTAMAIIRPDGTLHMVNRGFEAVTGFGRKELEGIKRWTEFMAGGNGALLPDGLTGREGEARQNLELQILDRFGNVKVMAGNWAVMAGTEHAVLSLVDISAQKTVEQALRESQASLAVAQQIAGLGSWEWEVTTNTLTWSDELYHLFGVDSATFVPSYEWFLDVIHPDDREMVIRAINDALYNKKPFRTDYRLLLPNGALRTHSTWADVTYDRDGNPLRLIGLNQDITWRTEAEQALRISEEKFSKAFRASPDSIVITRAQDGMYIDVNEAFEKITGYRREEVLGKTSLELQLWVDPDARMVMLRLMNQFGHVRNLEVRFRVKSGEIRELLWSADVIEYRGEACLIAISRDVTEQRHLEKELLESEARLFMKHEELKNLFHQMEAIRLEWEETMDCISDMFILTDKWGKVRRFNRAVETFTGLAHRDIVGRDWLPLLEEFGLKPHLESPGVELAHPQSGKRFVLNRYAFPTADIDGSTREVIIITDTTAIRLRQSQPPLRLAGKVHHPH
ncbi:PAS domain S-box protein [Geomonas sp.]|uniref:PAS domain-containing protein n=1 Tax=Geomonas sp. TaxID=2651584 RepID=UPI002B47EB1E|nr:PAS domain S-box protein [Geomonas sp.]HJV35980.1 PAS domain S-box protein [Geomonas sp.]